MKLQLTIDLDRLQRSGRTLEGLLNEELAREIRTGASVLWTEDGWNVGSIATVRDEDDEAGA